MGFITTLIMIIVFYYIASIVLSVYLRPALWLNRGLIKSIRKTKQSFHN